ncbi:cytospin-A-like isoform X4 [Diachasmimorpha longicaudata]|uniref:cytospin-A-like isoform X4 n=1 Tax=Diachasmimorpha longicaudata TaxID=58733 RepID=UPI0030B898D3
MMKFKSLFRRGQQSHLPHQQQQTGHPSPPAQAQLQQQPQVAQCLHPRQAPSVSSLEGKNDNIQNVNWQVKDSVKGAKVHSKSTLKNSNRMQELERELELLRKERARLEAGIRESTHDAKLIHELKTELAFVKEQHTLEVERLTEDNQVLRARLRDVAHSPLSDAEKHQLLQDAARDEPPVPQVDPTTTPSTDNPRCPTPEWDKRSSSSVSEVSVACLQDRILQMEETHYSTNEELQATIQELSDLQAQLSELQTDNERLTEEKAVLLESLCRQTEKLEDSRSKVDTLQGLLLREEKPQDSSKGYNTEREQKLVDLLKSAQEERESLLQKLEELSSELKVLRGSAEASTGEAERLAKRVHHLEVTVEAGSVERKQLDVELVGARQESANRNIEISRLATLLENARAKIEELEQSRQVESKSEADELLDAARREKDTLETQAAALQEQLARSHCDHDRLRDQYSQLQEECKVTRNNAKSAIDDLEYRLSQLKEERLSVNTELQLVRDSLAELQAQCQRHLEDKRELKAALSEAQRREREAQLRQYELERTLNDEKKLRQSESAEWEQFQNDLLMTVRVANDFKTEAQLELERVVMENKTLRDRLRALEGQVEKLNKGPGSRSSSTSSLNSIGTNDILSLKAPLRDQQQINNLICSANPTNNNKQQSTGNRKLTLSESQKSSGPVSLSPGELLDSAALNAKAIDFVRRNSVTDLSERKDPLCGLVKNGGSKRNALLKWCQNKTVGYRNIDITNFSSSWNDGLALCAILHSYLPDTIPYDSLSPSEKRRNFSLAFSAAESVGIQTTLNIGDMCQLERPDWQQVMTYVTSIYKHFET